MAVYKIGIGDKEFEIEAPEGTPETDLIAAAQAHQDPVVSDRPKKKSVMDTFTDILGRISTGEKDPFVGIGQNFAHSAAALGIVPDQIPEGVDQILKGREAQYQKAHPTDGIDWARVGGNAIPALAANPTSILAAPVIGAAEGMTMPATSDEPFLKEKAGQGLMGAAGGTAGYAAGKLLQGIADPVSRAVSKVINPETASERMSRLLKEVSASIDNAVSNGSLDLNSLPRNAVEKLRQEILAGLEAGVSKDPGAMARKADFDLLGVNPTQGQLTRDPLVFANEKNLRTAYPELTSHFSGQEKALRDNLEGILGAPNPAGSFGANNVIVNALRSFDSGLQKRVSDLYNVARESSGRHAIVPMDSVDGAYQEVLKSFGDNVPKAVQDAFNNAGRTSFNGASAQRIGNMMDAEGLIKTINDNYSYEPATKLALDRLRNAVKGAIESSEPGNSPFAAARQAASERFNLHEQIPGLAKASAGDLNVDKFANQFIINGPTQDVVKLAGVLRASDPEGFQAAKNLLGEHIQRAALGENPAGDAVTKGAGLAKAIRTIGEDKIKAFFSPDELDKLLAVSRVSGAINSEPAASAVNRSNSTVVAAGLANQLINKTPKVGSAKALLDSMTKSIRNQQVVNNALGGVIPENAYMDLSGPQASLYEDLIRQIGNSPRYGTAIGVALGADRAR